VIIFALHDKAYIRGRVHSYGQMVTERVFILWRKPDVNSDLWALRRCVQRFAYGLRLGSSSHQHYTTKSMPQTVIEYHFAPVEHLTLAKRNFNSPYELTSTRATGVQRSGLFSTSS
jgi:hypothetical protein